MMDKVKSKDMKKGYHYCFSGQPERLVYLGKNWSGNGYWHQFAKLDELGKVWAEIADPDLFMINECAMPTVEMLAADLATLEAENKALREGLEPFAREAKRCACIQPDGFIPASVRVTIGDLRRAAALLEKK